MKNILIQVTSRTMLVAAAGTLFLSTQAGIASPQWVTWEISAGGNGHQYMAVPGFSGLNWNMANTLAQQQGAYLATITSQSENDFVFSLINNPQFFSSFNGSGPAIGGYLPPGAGNGQFAWVTSELWSYTNWYPGRPDGYNVGDNSLEFFSEIGSTPGPKWNDINGNDTNIGGYVIERVVPEPSSLSVLAAGAMAFAAFKKRQIKSV